MRLQELLGAFRHLHPATRQRHTPFLLRTDLQAHPCHLFVPAPSFLLSPSCAWQLPDLASVDTDKLVSTRPGLGEVQAIIRSQATALVRSQDILGSSDLLGVALASDMLGYVSSLPVHKSASKSAEYLLQSCLAGNQRLALKDQLLDPGPTFINRAPST